MHYRVLCINRNGCTTSTARLKLERKHVRSPSGSYASNLQHFVPLEIREETHLFNVETVRLVDRDSTGTATPQQADKDEPDRKGDSAASCERQQGMSHALRETKTRTSVQYELRRSGTTDLKEEMTCAVREHRAGFCPTGCLRLRSCSVPQQPACRYPPVCFSHFPFKAAFLIRGSLHIYLSISRLCVMLRKRDWPKYSPLIQHGCAGRRTPDTRHNQS